MFDHELVIITPQNRMGDANSVRGVNIPPFEIYSNPTININDIKKRRFRLIDRLSPNSSGDDDV